MVALLAASACAGASEPPAPVSTSVVIPGPPLPAACDLVRPADVDRAIGVTVRRIGPPGGRDRCRYGSDAGDEVEITVDRPGSSGVVGAYRALNPGAEQLAGIGEEGAMRISGTSGELVFVKAQTRFFVVVASRSSSREGLLILGRVAAERM